MRATITHQDRQRLGSMLETARCLGLERRNYLDALEAELEDARRADPTDVPPDLVTMNSIVELLDLDTGEAEAYTIAYPESADAVAGRLSVLAPIGRAVLGSHAGDVVNVQTPSGNRQIQVQAVLYQPERAGHFHL